MLEELINGVGKLGFKLTSNQLDQFETYYHELHSWNLKTNLTAITDYKGVQVRHFLDSLTISLALPRPIPTGLSLIDIGTGAGFPGLPLKILYPEIRITLLEATSKKVMFLEHLVVALGLSDVTIIAERAEEAAHLSEYRECFEVVVSRAVAELPALAELTLPFCLPGGRAIAQKKGGIGIELDRAAHALEVLGGELAEIKEVPLSILLDRHCLVVIAKTAPTPTAYPRRPGMPAKRPLL
ncbi:MAG: 16S rRNA (guanine(527)-N(7))-methyltransferase RsmG [Dehalococcoidia bacterium]|nr:16S rRNA (guanine(527)-N(7))-methyltransferase RsmG [Dehalococcoidia bacterium]